LQIFTVPEPCLTLPTPTGGTQGVGAGMQQGIGAVIALTVSAGMLQTITVGETVIVRTIGVGPCGATIGGPGPGGGWHGAWQWGPEMMH
jgi:hypothetical protein